MYRSGTNADLAQGASFFSIVWHGFLFDMPLSSWRKYSLWRILLGTSEVIGRPSACQKWSFTGLVTRLKSRSMKVNSRCTQVPTSYDPFCYVLFQVVRSQLSMKFSLIRYIKDSKTALRALLQQESTKEIHERSVQVVTVRIEKFVRAEKSASDRSHERFLRYVHVYVIFVSDGRIWLVGSISLLPLDDIFWPMKKQVSTCTLFCRISVTVEQNFRIVVLFLFSEPRDGEIATDIPWRSKVFEPKRHHLFIVWTSLCRIHFDSKQTNMVREQLE